MRYVNAVKALPQYFDRDTINSLMPTFGAHKLSILVRQEGVINIHKVSCY